jgi:ATP-dependent exoDNAse (exonuclease V) alpha subunit
VTGIHGDGALTVTHHGGHGNITLPAEYVRDHVRLGYAATEHGSQSDTVETAIALASAVTTRRGLYVAATGGRDENLLCVNTDSDDTTEGSGRVDRSTVLYRARRNVRRPVGSVGCR